MATSIRVADYIADFVYSRLGVPDVFLLSGGGIMFLTDGIAKHGKLRTVCVHHEQTASMALESYSRMTENFGVGFFTTGPGSTNAITGLVGAWQDTVPCLFISGQVKRQEASYNAGIPQLRQFGVQELNIIPIVESICKYAVVLNDPTRIRYELEKAVALAKSGRPGPSWIDIPLDVQGALIDPDALDSYIPDEDSSLLEIDETMLDTIVKRLQRAERPVILAGRGVRVAGAVAALRELSEAYDIPVVTPFLGIDNLPFAHSSFVGKVGIKGDRAGNYAMQNADILFCIGTSLNVPVIGYDYKWFAREAYKVVVDVDLSSHRKKTIIPDSMWRKDARVFLSALKRALDHSGQVSPFRTWSEQTREWKAKYPVCLSEYRVPNQPVNMYTLIDELCSLSKPGDVFVADAGSAFYTVAQGIQLKDEQRYITSGGLATMGYTLPAAIGIAASRPQGEIIAITGDGSLQLNIQELQTLKHYDLPVKLFIINNDGYFSIRNTQKNYFQGRFLGEGPESGVTMPDIVKLAEVYGIRARRVHTLAELPAAILEARSHKGPFIVDVITPKEQLIIPTLSSKANPDGTMSSRPLEDMAPFLDRAEHARNMYVKEV